ncbi:phage holin family protein [Lutimaribacter marinistellae]|uniref:Phage holin family protein n=1 Tax=Lutimaribacter marinistellae TaxID=1820329 RepID=A0ABV7TP87_9RHOB
MSDPRTSQGPVSLVSEIVSQVVRIFRKEIHLATEELSESAHRATIALILLAVAFLFALVAFNILAGAAVAAIVEAGLQPHWAALAVGGLLLLFGGVFLWKGLNDLKARRLMPKRAMDSLKQDVRVVTEQFDER